MADYLLLRFLLWVVCPSLTSIYALCFFLYVNSRKKLLDKSINSIWLFEFVDILCNIWGKVFKNGPIEICGRQPLKNLHKGCLPQILLGPFLNTLTQLLGLLLFVTGWCTIIMIFFTLLLTPNPFEQLNIISNNRNTSKSSLTLFWCLYC